MRKQIGVQKLGFSNSVFGCFELQDKSQSILQFYKGFGTMLKGLNVEGDMGPKSYSSFASKVE